MATYRVKKGQTLAQIEGELDLNSQAILAANKGVSTLKTGQVLNIPRPPQANFQTPAYSSPAPAQQNPFTGNAIQTGQGSVMPQLNLPNPQNIPGVPYIPPLPGTQAAPNVYAPPNVTIPNRPPNQGFQTPTTNGFQAPSQQPYTGTAGYWAPYNQQQNQNGGRSPDERSVNTPTPTNNLPVRPLGVYTGDPKDPNTALWKNYWNDSVRTGYSGEPPAPVVMTQAQIWQMKAEQRRREAAKSKGDNVVAPYQIPYQQYGDPSLIRTITWGING